MVAARRVAVRWRSITWIFSAARFALVAGGLSETQFSSIAWISSAARFALVAVGLSETQFSSCRARKGVHQVKWE